MKAKMKRTIKVLSSFVVIAMVLICTVSMPVLAADDGIYSLSDAGVTYRSSGNNILITYGFGNNCAPYYRAYINDVLYDDGDGPTFDLTSANHVSDPMKFAFYFNPFGYSTGKFMTKGFVDISDLKTYSSFDMSSKIYIDMGAANIEDSLSFRGFYLFYFYDENLKYITHVTGDVNTYHPGSLTEQYELLLSGTVNVPAGARYLAIEARAVIETGGLYSGGTLYFTHEGTYLTVSIDSILENSLAMQDIKSALGDIKNSIDGGFADLDESINKGNQAVIDKIEDVIEGKDEWANQSQDRHNEQQELEDKADDVMDSIDDGTDLDKILPDNAQTQEDLENTITNWKGTNAWQQWKYILSPLMNDASIGQIMLMLVAFINISVLLIGR